MPIRRTQIRNYDTHSIGQEKILPDLIESDEDPLELTDLISNLDRIRSMIKKVTGENRWSDQPATDLRSLANRTSSMNITDTWGLIAKLQGIIIAPQGHVIDNGNGKVIVPNILVSNPLTNTFSIIRGFNADLGRNSFIYFDLPLDSESIIDAVIVDTDPYNPASISPFPNFPSENRIILAQRIGEGKVWFRFNHPAPFYSLSYEEYLASISIFGFEGDPENGGFGSLSNPNIGGTFIGLP